MKMIKKMAFFLVIIAFGVSILTACSPNDEEVDISGDDITPASTGSENPAPVSTVPVVRDNTGGATSSGLPVEISIEEQIDDSEEPPLHLYIVDVANLEVPEGEELGIHFVYEYVTPTGEATYKLNDPMDPSSGVVTEDGEPVIYRIVEINQKRIEDWGDPSQTQRIFMVEAPEVAYQIRYWVEVVTRRTSEITTKEISDVPWMTMNDVVMQGGQYMTVPE